MDPIDPADEREWEIHRAFEKKDKEIAALRADLAAANAELTRYRAMEEWLRSHPNDCFFDVMNGGKFQFTSDYEQHNYDQDDTLLGAFDQMMIRRASGEGR